MALVAVTLQVTAVPLVNPNMVKGEAVPVEVDAPQVAV
jgi:predicted component of type VI protein secretion system